MRSIAHRRTRVLSHALSTVVATSVLALSVAAQNPVAVRVVDQFGTEIPGSKLVVPGLGVFDTGGTVNLAAGTHRVDVYPGIGGGPQLSHLFRAELATIVDGQVSLDFEWITTNVTIHLRDQHGTAIPGSTTTIDGTGLGYRPTPFQVVLPITDLAVYPGLGGAHAEGGNKGYDIQLVPGIEGQTVGPTSLLRIPGSAAANETVAVHVGTTELDFRWITTEVTFRLRDQFAVDIPGSRMILYAAQGLGARPLPLTTTLPITDVSVYPDMSGSESESPVGGHGYYLNLLPGILGEYAGGHLQRYEGANPGHEVRVHSDTTEILFEWITTTLTIDVRDQYGSPIPGSAVFVAGAPASGYHATPFACTLPISDKSIYPLMAGSASEGPVDIGYDIGLLPGVEGEPQRRAMSSDFVFRWVGQDPRTDDLVQVHAGQTELNLQWITTSLTVDLRDQDGVSIPGARVRLANFIRGGRTPATDFRPVPFQITLPITDPAVYPKVFGAASEDGQGGYDILLHPGLDGQPQYPCCGDLLYRYAGTTTATSEPVHVAAGQTSLVFQWATVACSVQVATTAGMVLPGSTLTFPPPFLAHATGSVVLMPITDNSVYPDIQGAYANGYPIRVTPQDIAPTAATFEFEVVPGGALQPASFTIGGQGYTMTCGYNRPPVADAGPNRTITTNAQAGTVIAGTGTDPDPNLLSYRWLEGTTVLVGPSPVGASGAASLPLAVLPLLSIGVHVLTLEVSDGQFSATASMTLTVGNSAPVASCGGGGTFEAGVDTVYLTGSVGDFDGDTISWSWMEGTNVLATGLVPTAPGGAPTAIPVAAFTTGAAGQLAVGTHPLRLIVGDGINPPQTCEAIVTVVDTAAPVLAPTCDCQLLWPPNHRMVDIVIQANARDPSGGPVFLSATVSSSEDPDKDGDGHTIPDWTEPVIDQSTGRITLALRAERSGKGPGRTYTISIRAMDAAGNVSTATVVCVAPHDQGR